MITFATILVSIVVISLILYFGEFRFEYKIEKNATNLIQRDKSSLNCLSNTEYNIFKLLAEGKTNQEIAESLFISVNTVKKHISNIFKKTKIKSRKETRNFKELINSNI